MDKYQKAARKVLLECMGIQPEEKLLIVTDAIEKPVSDIFYEAAKHLHLNVVEILIPVGQVSGQEPPKEAACEMLKYPVQLLITTKSLTHTFARKNACKNGARIATMATISKEIIGRCISIDYDALVKRNIILEKILSSGKKARVKAEKGTDIVFDISGRKALPDSGVYTQKGAAGNLPAGEVFIAPNEGKTNGVYVVDASFAGLGMLSKAPIRVTVKGGYAVNVEGPRAEEIEAQLKSRLFRNIAELGIGTNPKAKITGVVLEDEKVIGTAHIAIGNNFHFGGKVNVPLHIDGVITKPSVWVDDRQIIERGKLLV